MEAARRLSPCSQPAVPGKRLGSATGTLGTRLQTIGSQDARAATRTPPRDGSRTRGSRSPLPASSANVGKTTAQEPRSSTCSLRCYERHLTDVTIVNVALPDMVADLRASFGPLQWVVDAYALALAALLLGAGSIADRVGHRRAYVGGLVIFAVSSLMCGLAPDSAVLITARAVQGVGAAAMFATTFALLNSAYAGRDRGSAYGIWGAVAGASAAVGPIL